MIATLRVTDTGWLTTFQDLGRVGSEQRGVPTGGAADQHSASVANLLVGNPRGAALVESVGGELALVPDRDVLVAVTGAPAYVTVGDLEIERWTPVLVPAGCELRVSDIHSGTRVYVAVGGALRAPRLLGSVAPDARMGFPQTIATGSAIEVETGFAGFDPAALDALADDEAALRLPVPELCFGEGEQGEWTVDVVESAELDRVPGMRELLAETLYTVTDRSNHVGLRLDGAVTHPESDEEIVSHGVPVGALEVPHADELIVLGRYRSLTAGYPIVGFATRASLPVLGQAGPGRALRFRWVDRRDAVLRHAAREHELRALEIAVRDSFARLGYSPRATPASALAEPGQHPTTR